MAKIKNDYFQLLCEQVEYSVKAAALLEEILLNYSLDTISAQREKIHEVEHSADKIMHDIRMKLSVEFITPIDQEDILRLAQIIDDVTDALDDVVLRLYMYHVQEITEDAKEIVKVVHQCVISLNEAIKELKNFKKNDGVLQSALIKINDIENKADGLSREAIHRLFAGNTEMKALIGNMNLYEALENCCDECEHAADVMEEIVIKNT
ncbi:MAG: DUF47 domain-containing protein [Lachnospiraceae bacterium]|nr:DUF47 domain-containing protein [Lachnospiraceae bacterium]